MVSQEHLESLDKAVLIDLVVDLSASNAKQSALIVKLEARIAELESRLGMNSKNSSKPPSSDPPFKHLTPPSLKKDENGKKSGGQTGHQGHGLKKVATPDRTESHCPNTCDCCGGSLTDASATASGTWQVFDLPSNLTLEVTEHQRFSRCCPHCRSETQGTLPVWLSEATPCQWGPQCRALGVYLMEQHHIPFERTQSIFADLFGAAPSEGTLFNWMKEAYRRLEPVEALIAEELVKSPQVGADETPARGIGWQHCLVNKDWTWYGCSNKRGREAMDAFGLLPRFRGLLMSDCLVSYMVYGGRRSLCNAHLLRDLTRVFQWGHQWPDKMIALLLSIWNRIKESGGPLSHAQLNTIYRQFGKILALGRRENETRLVEKSETLLDRLQAYRDWYLRFATTTDAWFDNNISERALRMMKLHVKISGCFRSLLGCQILCRVRGYLNTMHKQGQPLFQALLSVMSGKPLLPPLIMAMN